MGRRWEVERVGRHEEGRREGGGQEVGRSEDGRAGGERREDGWTRGGKERGWVGRRREGERVAMKIYWQCRVNG